LNKELRIEGTPVSPLGTGWRLPKLRSADWFFALATVAFAAPTIWSVATVSWATEQGGHGPLVVATGIWLIARQWRAAFALRQPGSALLAGIWISLCLAFYMLSRITGIIEVEGFAMYGALIGAAYALWGARVLRQLWFPILYLALSFPPPETIVAAVTNPIKIAISAAAVDLLHTLGYPIASSGVTIQIAQYELLVAAACAGLNSVISLTAIGLFYIYVLHNANYRYAALLFLAILPAAVFANFARVIILILVTYHLGDAAAQGFIHNFAGVTMFVIALLAIFTIDRFASPLRRRLARSQTGE
jgi:exosortase